MKYFDMSKDEAKALLLDLKKQYDEVKAKNLSLDMSRGKPCNEQLDLSNEMLGILSADDFKNNSYRNYGVLDGIPECKKLFADLTGVAPENVIIGGNSSLNMMYDTLARCMLYGFAGGKPWCKEEKVKFLAPVPGYDRHFAVCESLGIEMINVPMTENGPDMDVVEELVKNDESIKGMWNVPKYSNPDGYVYSAETVKRLAKMECKAKDFVLMWDNAYIVHSLYGKCAEIPEIISECKKAGNPDRAIEFVSTSKISFPGAGVAALISSKENVDAIKKIMGCQTIGHDKINQLRHVKYFGDADGLKAYMQKHADILRPKFEIVNKLLTEELGALGIASWTKPEGGYFVSFYVSEGCAKRTVALCKEAGVVLTGAGAAYPYGKDEKDSNIRIAPSLPPVAELSEAISVLCLCTKIAVLEKLTA